jgi:hypothetical protein
MVYSPASDGGGFPADPTGRLPAARSVANLSDLYIDGDIYTIEDGKLERVIPAEGWNAAPPPDALLREAPSYRQMTSSTDRRSGNIYAYDEGNARIVAIDKNKGSYVEQYRLAGGDPGFGDLRDLLVLPPQASDAPATLWWLSARGLNQVLLQAVPDAPGSAASPSPSASQSAAPSRSAKPTASP